MLKNQNKNLQIVPTNGLHAPSTLEGENTMENLTNPNNATSNSDKIVDQIEKELASSNGKIPPGKYTATISNAYTELRLPRNYDMLHLDFILQSEPFVGRKEWKQYHLTTKKARNFMKGELKKLDIEIKCREDIQVACEKLVGRRVGVTVTFPPNGNRVIYISADAALSEAVLDPDAIWDD